MPICIHCSEPLKCTCEQPDQPIGQTAIGCPKKSKGKLWIHVTDDLGKNLKDVPVSGASPAETNAAGLAMFDDLPAKDYDAELKASEAQLKLFDAPEKDKLKKTVPVKDGMLVHVLFTLTRKAHLRVSFVLKSGPSLSVKSPFETHAIEVKAAYTGTGAQPPEASATSSGGSADFKLVSAGKYVLTPDYSGVKETEFDFVKDGRNVELGPGDEEPFVFELVRKAALTVKFVFKADPKKSDDQTAFTASVIKVKAVPKASGPTVTASTTDGSAVFTLTPGAYSLTPDYSGVDSSAFEYKDETREIDVADENKDPVVFELARKAKLKVQFVYKHDPKLYLQDKDGIVNVKADFKGNTFHDVAITALDTAAGIADFKSVSAGKYTLTPDYSKLDKCAFDFVDEARELTVWPDDEPVTFEIEPLYQQVQFIGHCLLTIPNQVYKKAPSETLDTAASTGITGDAQPSGEWKDQYHGLVDDVKDIQKRLDLIADTLKTAQTEAEDDPTILKIFMVPECFFQGAYGAYLYEDIFGNDYSQPSSTPTPGLLTKLNELVCGPDWKDWIFSFGTVNCDLTATGSVEMMNYAPVIRGGLGPIPKDATNETHVRLIQKAKNSAELIDDARLDPDYVLELAKTSPRRPAVNETHQFQGTENEARVGKYLLELLDDAKNQTAVAKFTEVGVGIPVELWNELKVELKKSMDTLGASRTARLIRTYDISKMPPELKDWVYSGYIEDGAWRFDALASGPNWQQIVHRFVTEKWVTSGTTVLKPVAGNVGKLAWQNKLKPAARKAILDLVNTDVNGVDSPLFKSLGIDLAYQKTALQAKIQDLLTDDDAAKNFINDITVLPDKYTAGKFVIWEKLVELYLAEKNIVNLPLKAEGSNLSYRDYCFASARKAGPFLDLAEADKLTDCKKLIFGLEICADHAAGRLKYALIARPKSGPECNIDIELIPSCGMNPVQLSVAARTGGYVFNCDGWIHVTPTLRNQDQGRTIEVRFDKPRPADDKPFYPHTLVGKGGDSLSMADFKPTVTALKDSLSVDIFGRGAGELHVYDPVALPK